MEERTQIEKERSQGASAKDTHAVSDGGKVWWVCAEEQGEETRKDRQRGRITKGSAKRVVKEGSK
jgi:hypothetical protein